MPKVSVYDFADILEVFAIAAIRVSSSEIVVERLYWPLKYEGTIEATFCICVCCMTDWICVETVCQVIIRGMAAAQVQQQNRNLVLSKRSSFHVSMLALVVL